jgi:heme-binding protein
MTIAVSGTRWGLFGVLTICALGGAAAVLALPSATAAQDPCAASEIARTIGSVSTNTGNYLDSHPETNAAMTSAAQQPPPQALVALKTYFDANPQAGKDMQTLQQPLVSLSTQCKLPITLPQVLQMMQGMQGQLPGALSQLPGGASLPGGAPSPLGGVPSLLGGAASPLGAGSGVTATPAAPVGNGPLPGPATTTTR